MRSNSIWQRPALWLAVLLALTSVVGSGVISPAFAAADSWATNGPASTTVWSIVVDPANTNNVFAGTSSGVFKSSDGGNSWTATSATGFSTANPVYLAIDPVTPTTLYASFAGSAAYSGLYKSTDGGMNWSPMNNPESPQYMRAIAIDPTNPTTLYTGIVGGSSAFKSTDSGANWSPIYPSYSFVVEAIAVDPDNPATVYIAGYASSPLLYKSTDGGATWTNGSAGLTGVSVRSIAIDPANSNTLYVGINGSGGGVFKSTDGGVNWSASNTGLTPTDVYPVVIDPNNPNKLYAGTYGGGVFESTDGGANWSAFNSGLTNLNIYSFAIAPSNSGILYAGTAGDGVFALQVVPAETTNCTNTTDLIAQLQSNSSAQHANPVYASAGQSFTVPTEVTEADGITAYFSYIAAQANITLNLYEGPASGNIGTPIATASYTNEGSAIWQSSVDGLDISFKFNNPVNLTPGNVYYYLLSPSFSNPATFGFTIANDNPYSSGTYLSGASNGTVSSSPFPSWDLKFSVFACSGSNNTPPTADAGGPYSGDEGSAIALSDASASDGDGDSLTYSWTVDSGLCSFDDASALNPNLTCTDNGSFVTTLTVDDGTETASDTAAVTVDNVAPTATFGNDGPVDEGDDFTLSLTSPTDPGADTFAYAFDCGDGSGYSTASASSSATCATTAPGVRAVKGKIIDDDGGETEYTNSVTVTDVPPFLDIPDDLTGNQGQTVEVPLNLTANGDQISAVAFTLGFDTQCLAFDTTDSNNDGLPDAITLNQATGFQLGVNIDNAGQGSLGLVVSPEASTPPLPTFSNGAVATVTFTIVCGDERTALTLSNASFGNDQGASVSGQTDGGTIDINRPPVAVDDVSKTTPSQAVTIDVLANDTDPDAGDTHTVANVTNPSNGTASIQNNEVVYTPNANFLGLDSFEYTISDGNLTDVGTVQVAVGIRGDANADVTVDAGDLPAVVLEILDVDGNNWLDTLGGTFLGNPVGTDSNEDESITAGDLSCTVRLLLFGVEDRCAPEQRSGVKAILGLPASVAVQNGTVQVPIRYTTNGNQAAALALALEIDAEQVTFDSADNDGNGLPDGLQLNLASGFQAMAIYKDSLLNLVIFSAELKALPDGVVATLSLAVESQTGDGPALRFSQSQPASLGGVDGAAIPVQIDNDAVTGLDQPVFQHQIFLPALGR